MKIISLMILAICCIMTGQYIACRYKMRVVLLEKIIVMLNLIEGEINYLEKPVDKIIFDLKNRSELSELEFLSYCNVKLENGEDLPTAWSNSLENLSVLFPLKKSDTDILLSFGSNLGKSDKQGQISNCRVHSNLIEEKISEARALQKKYSSLFTSFGILCGICIFIILI